MRRLLTWTLGLGAAASLVAGIATVVSALRPADDTIPTTTVQRGRVSTDVQAIGELRAVTSQALNAPAAGAQLRILTMKITGDAVKKGDVVVQFDPAEQEFRLEEQQSVEREARLEIEKLDADRDAQVAQDAVDLATARFELRKAELDVRGSEMLAAIEARKRALTLDEARRRLAQLEGDLGTRTQSSAASLAVAREKQTKARLAIDQAQHLLDQMVLRADIDGVVSVRENREGNVFFWGMTFAEYRQGDNVSSGRPVAEVLAPGAIELAARLPETERARISAGQTAQVALHARETQPPLEARVAHVGSISTGSRFFDDASGPTRMFDVTFTLPRIPASARPGLSARIALAGAPLDGVLFVPRQAVFERNGTPIVYTRARRGFEAREVKIVARTATVVVLEQVDEGVEVALTDPTRKAGSAAPKSALTAPTRVASR